MTAFGQELEGRGTEYTCHHQTQAGHYCPECKWFAVGPPSGTLDYCADCGSLIEVKIITPDTLGISDLYKKADETRELPYSNHKKGLKHEREANRILSSLYFADRVSRTGGNDPFELVDIIGLHPERKPKLVQVKTNRFAGKQKYKQLAELRLSTEHVDFEVWVRYDEQGWEFHRWNDEEFQKYLQVDVCDYKKVREKWQLEVAGKTPERPVDASIVDFTEVADVGTEAGE